MTTEASPAVTVTSATRSEPLSLASAVRENELSPSSPTFSHEADEETSYPGLASTVMTFGPPSPRKVHATSLSLT